MRVIIILLVILLSITVSDMACNKIGIKEAIPRLKQTMFLNFSYEVDTTEVEVVPVLDSLTLDSTKLQVDSLLNEADSIINKYDTTGVLKILKE